MHVACNMLMEYVPPVYHGWYRSSRDDGFVQFGLLSCESTAHLIRANLSYMCSMLSYRIMICSSCDLTSPNMALYELLLLAFHDLPFLILNPNNLRVSLLDGSKNMNMLILFAWYTPSPTERWRQASVLQDCRLCSATHRISLHRKV